MPQVITISVKLSATVDYEEESGVFVSRSPLLNIISQGDSEAEAKEALGEAIGMQLAALYKFDRLHQLLLRAGFTNMTGIGPPEDIESFPGEYVSVTAEHSDRANQFEIEVPLTLVAAAAKNHAWQHSH